MKLTLKTALLPISLTLLVISEINSSKLPIIGQAFRFSSRASAQVVTDYIPPVGTKKTSRTTGAGSRGCDANGNGSRSNHRSIATSLQLLAPNNHIPTTISAYPTFYWFVSATSLLVRFTLVEPGVVKPIVDRRFLLTRPGVVSVTLPSDVSGLVAGKQYRWTVALVCDEERPSANTYAYGWIKRIAPTPELRSRLAGVNHDSQTRALIYARSGIWYDALNSSFIAYKANPQNKEALWYFSRLLAQVGIPALSDQKLQQSNIVSSYESYAIKKWH